MSKNKIGHHWSRTTKCCTAEGQYFNCGLSQSLKLSEPLLDFINPNQSSKDKLLLASVYLNS